MYVQLLLTMEEKACDKVLERMEQLLHSFKSDLGNISGEIQTLQYLSSSLYVKLGNRKTVQSVLEKVLDAINLPDVLKKYAIIPKYSFL